VEYCRGKKLIRSSFLGSEITGKWFLMDLDQKYSLICQVENVLQTKGNSEFNG
jgi:hypothetical protein